MKTTGTKLAPKRGCRRPAITRPIEATATSSESVRRRVWGPIVLRAVALGIALVGLAGIGAAVTHAPRLATPTVARAGFALDGLSTRALAELAVTGGSSANPAGIGAPQGALARVSQAGSPSPSRANSPPSSPAALPCPCAPSPENERGLSASARASPGAGAAASEARVVLNRASAAELQRLPGVGAKRAEAILQLRQRLGRFRKPSDLLRVKGIGPRTLERMSPYLVLD